MHDSANTVDACPGVFGLAIPNAPVQSLDLGDDRGLRRHPCRITGREAAGDLLQMLPPHADVKPVEHRQPGDVGISENASKARAPVGEGGQYGAFGSADGVEVPADQHFDVRVGSCDGAENLAATRFRFDVADPHFQVTFCVFATPDEGGIQSDLDRRRHRFPPVRRHHPEAPRRLSGCGDTWSLCRCQCRAETSAPARQRPSDRSPGRPGEPEVDPAPVTTTNATAS